MNNRSECFTLFWMIFVVISQNIVQTAVTRQQVQDIYNGYKRREYGDGTYYGNYPIARGACTLDPLSPMATQPGWILVAAGPKTFQKSLGCGMCLEIQGSGQGSGNNPILGKRRAVIVDYCAAGCGNNGMDFFIPGDGRWTISYVAVDCPTLPGRHGKIHLRFQGSNTWYIKLQARNTKVPTAGIEVLVRGKYHCLTRVNDNFFVGMGLGRLSVPLRFRLTAITGEQLHASVPAIKNDVSFASEVQYQGINGAREPSKILCFGQGNKYPYPRGGMRE
ncbi:uncharacterized protein LOC114975679 [Acropora millepora]|uniref:uncharacterized protein LOC114975679 n=1 Tax=Acropora millepora TaxID=45264 RepID=UPI001CF5D27A|nr:uncharacterized protein LOC114975679 [Acropora millepora]